MRNGYAVLAFGLLTISMPVGMGLVFMGQWLGLALATTAFVLALVGACRRAESAPQSRTALTSILLVVVGIGLFFMLARLPTGYRYIREFDPALLAFQAGVVLLGLLAAGYAWPGAPGSRWRPALFLGGSALLGAWLILAADFKPQIDVWQLQQGACAALLRGENPYATSYSHFYGEEVGQFIAPQLLDNDNRIRSFPYLPLSLLLTMPGYLLGDVRWSVLAACIGTAAGTVALGRRAGLPPGHPAELAALTVPCSPAGLFLMEVAWTEPFLALAFVAGMAALVAGRAGGLAWGAVAFLKQYGILTLPAVWASGRVRARTLLLGVTAAALVTLPFILWDPHAFWLGTVGFHIYSPFRSDCVSFPAMFDIFCGYQLPPALGFVAAAGTIAVLVLRQANRLACVPLGAAATLLAFFLFNKAAHINYYWLADAVLAVAVILSSAEDQPATCPAIESTAAQSGK